MKYEFENQTRCLVELIFNLLKVQLKKAEISFFLEAGQIVANPMP